jgi:hypothetical protein
MTIEILYFEGCPNHERLRERLPALLKVARVATEPTLREITTEQDAEREWFLGSPTLRVNGHDVEPAADDRTRRGARRLDPRAARARDQPPTDDLHPAGRRARGAPGRERRTHDVVRIQERRAVPGRGSSRPPIQGRAGGSRTTSWGHSRGRSARSPEVTSSGRSLFCSNPRVASVEVLECEAVRGGVDDAPSPRLLANRCPGSIRRHASSTRLFTETSCPNCRSGRPNR